MTICRPFCARRSRRSAQAGSQGRTWKAAKRVHVRLLQRVVHPGSVAEQPVGERTQAGVVVTDDGSERSAVAASCPFERAWLDLAGAMRVFRHLTLDGRSREIRHAAATARLPGFARF